MFSIKFPTKRIFPNFHILKINGMMSFCNLFMERPSYSNIARQCADTVTRDHTFTR